MTIHGWTLHVPDNATRRQWVKRQKADLDPIPVTTVEDPQHLGCLVTARRAWDRAADNEADWHLFMADDVLPAPGTVENIRRIITAVGDAAYVSLFCSRNRQLDSPRRWAVGYGTVYGLAYLMPAWAVAELSATVEAWNRFIPRNYQHDDGVLAIWAQHNQYDCYATNPSLFQHVGLGHSLMGHSAAVRTHAAHLATEPLPWPTPTRGELIPMPVSYGAPSKRLIHTLQARQLIRPLLRPHYV